MGVIINEIKDTYKILLHKVNGEVVGELPFEVLNSLSNSMNECGQIEVSVNKYYRYQIGKKLKRNIYYDEIKNERIISLDGGMYLIRDIKEDTKNNKKNITCYSLEKKLEKITISVEDLGFQIQDSDEENGIFNLDDYMYEETGWRFGYVDYSVKYNDFSEDLIIDEISYDESTNSLEVNADYNTENGDMSLNVHNKTPKMRWQESVDCSWLDFLNQNISTQFNCYVHYDNVNKLVDLYDMRTFGENIGIVLSYDNYIKSLEKSTSSSDIVTKMKLIGNEEECVIQDATVTGEDYIEDYSYFIEEREMSDDLINALNTYYEIVEVRSEQWKQLRNDKLEANKELTDKKNREKVLLEEMRVKETSIEFYKSKVGTDEDITGKYTELLDEAIEEYNAFKNEEEEVYNRIMTLEENINNLETEMGILNTLCKKVSATDSNDNLIFNSKLLDELKMFICSETFSDDSFYDAEEIIEYGKNKLSIVCRPTKTWDINVNDFTSRLISNKFRKQWKGRLGLGDVIVLYNDETDVETYIYMVGYEKTFKDKGLSLTLSNKKESQDVVRYINDFLKLAKNNNKIMVRNRRLWNAQKFNRLNLNRDEVM